MAAGPAYDYEDGFIEDGIPEAEEPEAFSARRTRGPRYHVLIVGSRRQVWYGTALRTSGGLYKKDLFQDRYGNIKSRKASAKAKRARNLGTHQLPKGSHEFIPGGRTGGKRHHGGFVRRRRATA